MYISCISFIRDRREDIPRHQLCFAPRDHLFSVPLQCDQKAVVRQVISCTHRSSNTEPFMIVNVFNTF